MFKKLIFSSLVLTSLFVGGNNVHAEDDKDIFEDTKQDSSVLLGKYIVNDSESSKLLETTYIKESLLNIEDEFLLDLIEDLLDIEKPTKDDGIVLINTLETLTLKSEYFEGDIEEVESLLKDLESSHYSKDVKEVSQVEFDESIETISKRASILKFIDYSFVTVIFGVIILAVVLIKKAS